MGRIAAANYKTIKSKTKFRYWPVRKAVAFYMEESFVACEWSYDVRMDYEPKLTVMLVSTSTGSPFRR